MEFIRTNTLNVILGANAFLLVMGTVVQVTNNPAKDVIMSLLFIAWVVLFAWRIKSARAEAEAR